MQYVPVVDKNNQPLMPAKKCRAIRWVKSGKATPFYKRGIWCVRLNVEPSARNTQPIAVGIDPGSKREGLTVKAAHATFLNVQAHAVDWVKNAVKTRRIMRRGRRNRKTPCRQNRKNRLRNTNRLPPSTRARWLWKLRLCWWLKKLYPITTFIVEDIKAVTKGKRRWDVMFSPLEVGKKWFYSELAKLGEVITKRGYETKEMRDFLGLKKSKNKLAENFSAHCVDSWVLANWYVGGHNKPDNTKLLIVIPLQFHHRQLHRQQHAPGHIRPRYGGTMSAGFKRGSIVEHPKYGLCYVGGFMDSPTKKQPSRQLISLHCLKTGKRLTQNTLPTDLRFLSYNSWRSVDGI